MIAEHEFEIATPFAGAVSEALAELVADVKDSVVQVRSGREGSGSGIIWRTDGVIMTNHHVVAHRDEATVLLNDNRELRARVIARDPVLDLAALRVGATDLPAAEIGASQQVRVGELVLAIGHPWGQRGVVTAGVISAIGEIEVSWRRSKAEYIRSDVRLAPGNSGGPMLDAQGRVIGINAMIFGGDLGVAIPSHIATQFLLVAEGQRPLLGVGVQVVPLPVALQAATQRDRALLVVGVQENSAAAHAGVFVGDVLLDLANKPLLDAHTLTYTLAQQTVGAQVPLRILRGGDLRTLDVTLSEAAQAAA